MKKKVVPTLRREVKVKVDIVTSDDIKIYYAAKFQDFTARENKNVQRTNERRPADRVFYNHFGKGHPTTY